jgi:hypothetical protein
MALILKLLLRRTEQRLEKILLTSQDNLCQLISTRRKVVLRMRIITCRYWTTPSNTPFFVGAVGLLLLKDFKTT